MISEDAIAFVLCRLRAGSNQAAASNKDRSPVRALLTPEPSMDKCTLQLRKRARWEEVLDQRDPMLRLTIPLKLCTISSTGY